MDVKVYNTKENYDNFKDEILSDFNYFFTFENNLRWHLNNLDIKFSDERIAESAFIEIETYSKRPTKTICKLYCSFLRPDTLNEELAVFHFYPKHARILLGKEGNSKSVTLDRVDKSSVHYDFKMILTNSNDENKEVQTEMDVSIDDNKVAFNLLDIYKHLELWRKEKQIVLEDEKAEYLCNVMGELGKLSDAIKDRNKVLISQKEEINLKRQQAEHKIIGAIFGIKDRDKTLITQKEQINLKIQQAEHKIIDALCSISVLTINAGADVNYEKRITKIEDYVLLSNRTYETLLNVCGNFAMSFTADALNGVLRTCAVLSYKLGFNYELAMLEKISSLGNNLTRYELTRITD